jgi:twitching motility two-component system response regulator PilG
MYNEVREGNALRKTSWSPIIDDGTSMFDDVQDASPNRLVVIIDDSITVRKIVEICLSREGFEVLGFAGGVEALLWLTGPQGRSPGLILLDITMPGMDGYEVARYLKARPHVGSTVIVMLTRRDGMVDRLKSRLVGAVDHLSKPFQTQQLLKVVTSHLGAPQREDTPFSE